MAFFIGWAIYMIGVAVAADVGYLELAMQPIMAILTSAIGVMVGCLAGVIFEIPIVLRLWSRSAAPACAVIGVGCFVLMCGRAIGLDYAVIIPGDKEESRLLHPGAALGGYFLILFAISNWPIMARKSELH